MSDTSIQSVLGPVDAESFADFCGEWTMEVTQGSPSTVELGRRFAYKLLSQWMDAQEFSEDPVYCDGAGDGGIDLAILQKGDSSDPETEESGDTWYLVQSKYGSAFQGTSTLLAEGQKIIETLDGKRTKLSSLAEGLLERINTFRKTSSASDRIVLVLATVEPLTEAERRTLKDIRAMGRERLGGVFDVLSVSIETIYSRLQAESEVEWQISVPLKGQLAGSSDDLLVGAIGLLDLYEFLKAYRAQTEDLDQLYEKNVRRFLGGGGKVNKAMQQTLNDSPERFGLYNNGITIVVRDFSDAGSGLYSLCDPYVVNGCQTTRTIWEVLYRKLEAGGTGENPDLEAWRARASRGRVVTKVVKVGAGGDEMLQAITRFTNTQNPVREKDFLTLTSDFRTWASEMADTYDLYLEIQRGGWESRRALQKQKPGIKQFSRCANAFDLIKVYGAGWLGEAGTAFGRNAYFLPNGSIFKRIMAPSDTGTPFGLDDLYASYLLMVAADGLKFGRGAEKSSRRQSRFLFYFVVIELLRDVLLQSGKYQGLNTLTSSLIRILGSDDVSLQQAVLQPAASVIDTYLSQGENTVYSEPTFINAFNGDLNAFLKWEQLGKSNETSPKLKTLLAITRQSMAYGESPPFDRIVAALD